MRSGTVKVIVLGNPDRGDDGAAMVVGARIQDRVQVVLAGRPGPSLLDLLPEDEVCILMDVTCSGAPPGTIRKVPLSQLTPELLPDLRLSSHGFGAGETLALARALGRSLPTGYFLGIEGERYELGGGFSPAVEEKLTPLETLLEETVRSLARFAAPPAKGTTG